MDNNFNWGLANPRDGSAQSEPSSWARAAFEPRDISAEQIADIYVDGPKRDWLNRRSVAVVTVLAIATAGGVGAVIINGSDSDTPDQAAVDSGQFVFTEDTMPPMGAPLEDVSGGVVVAIDSEALLVEEQNIERQSAPEAEVVPVVPTIPVTTLAEVLVVPVTTIPVTAPDTAPVTEPALEVVEDIAPPSSEAPEEIIETVTEETAPPDTNPPTTEPIGRSPESPGLYGQFDPGSESIVVERGMTIYSIADYFEVDPKRIKALNSIEEDLEDYILQTGSTLILRG